MSQTHQQILQMHFAFMAELRKIEDVVTHESYEAIEKGYKDLAVLADSLADKALLAEKGLD